jgi:hypothetical protein
LERRGKSKASDTPGSVNEEATSNPPACQLEHSVEADVSPSFAWNWRTDVKNWDDPPARFQLDGPFARGSSGTTVLPGQAPLHWRIRDVQPGRSSSLKCRSIRRCYRLSGGLTPPQTAEHESRSALSCLGTMPVHSRNKSRLTSARLSATA